SEDWLNLSRVRFARLICGKQQDDFGLEGVSILEFVDEKMGEASLQLGPDTGVISDEIAGLDQKIEEVEAPGTRFQRFVSTDSGLQRLMQERSEICVVCRDECIQLLLYDVSAEEHLVTRECPESGAPSPLPTPASSAHKATERCFETIVVAATHGF